MNRGERRRLEREIEKARTQPGVGQGWRLTSGKRPRRYPVREHGPVDIEALERDSCEAQARRGIVMPDE